MIKTTPKKEKCKKAKWSSEEALQIAEERREAKGKGEKERHTYLNAEFQRIAEVKAKSLSHVRLFATPLTSVHGIFQARVLEWGARRDEKKPSSVINAKKWRKTTEWERLEISLRKLEIPREHFMQDGHNKG